MFHVKTHRFVQHKWQSGAKNPPSYLHSWKMTAHVITQTFFFSWPTNDKPAGIKTTFSKPRSCTVLLQINHKSHNKRYSQCKIWCIQRNLYISFCTSKPLQSAIILEHFKHHYGHQMVSGFFSRVTLTSMASK